MCLDTLHIPLTYSPSSSRHFLRPSWLASFCQLPLVKWDTPTWLTNAMDKERANISLGESPVMTGHPTEHEIALEHRNKPKQQYGHRRARRDIEEEPTRPEHD